MEKNILIPGAGGFAAINTIKSLRLINYIGKLITTDSDPLSAGFYLADSYYVLPKANSRDFFEKALNIILKENIKIILPTSGFDIFPYSKHKKELNEMGITVFMSDYETIKNCTDKLLFYNQINNDFKVPLTKTNIAKIDNYPVFAKPRFGKGSRNSFLCNNRVDLNYIITNYKNMIFSEYLPGKEYTIDVLSDLNSNALYAVPRERISVKEGVSFKGRIINNDYMKKECMRLANFLKLKGPSCMQMKEDAKGELYFIEVNPRMGGGTIMATLAGANIPYDMLRILENKKIEIPELKEITILRYYEEIVI